MSRLVTGVLATLLVQLVQWTFFVATEIPGGLSFLAFHAALVAGLLLPLAALQRKEGPSRRVALAYAGLPVALSAWPESADLSASTFVAVATFGALAAVVMLGDRLHWLGNPHPVPAAGAGAAAGAGLMALRHGHASPGQLVWAAFLTTAFAALAWTAMKRRGSRAAWAAGLVPVLLLAPATGPWRPPAPPAGGTDDPPVVLIVLDAVRADHLDLYGYRRETMPNLTAMARDEGLWTRRSLANAALSLPSHASMMTGLYPPDHGAHLPFLDDPRPPAANLYPLPADGPVTAAELLSAAGYWTVGLSGNYTHLHPALGLGRGFDVYRAAPSPAPALFRQTPWCNATALGWHLLGRDRTGPCQPYREDVPYRNAATITDEALATLEAAGDRPLFLFLNYFDAHNPFLAPGEYAGTYEGELHWNHARRLDDAVRNAGAPELTPSEQAHLAAAYDAELRYLDDQLGRLLDALRSHPRWEEMLVVVTSDHGMSLGDNGLLGHESHLFDPMVRVPLVIKPGARGPRRPDGGVDTGLRQSVDLFPLLLAAAGIPAPDGIDGRPWDVGREAAMAWLFVDGKLAHRTPERFARELRMVESGSHKLIESTGGELWSLAIDEHGRELASALPDPDDTATLLAPLGGWARYDPERYRSPDEDPELMRQLRSLGYVE